MFYVQMHQRIQGKWSPMNISVIEIYHILVASIPITSSNTVIHLVITTIIILFIVQHERRNNHS